MRPALPPKARQNLTKFRGAGSISRAGGGGNVPMGSRTRSCNGSSTTGGLPQPGTASSSLHSPARTARFSLDNNTQVVLNWTTAEPGVQWAFISLFCWDIFSLCQHSQKYPCRMCLSFSRGFSEDPREQNSFYLKSPFCHKIQPGRRHKGIQEFKLLWCCAQHSRARNDAGPEVLRARLCYLKRISS